VQAANPHNAKFSETSRMVSGLIFDVAAEKE
jgi:hypothetical protein